MIKDIASIVILVAGLLWFIDWTFGISDVLKFWIAKRKADLKSAATGTRIRFYVIPVGDKLKVISTRQLSRINRRLPKGKRIDIKWLLENAYYKTK